MKAFKRAAIIPVFLLAAFICRAADTSLIGSAGCAGLLKPDASGCAGRIELSKPYTILVSPECSAGAKTAMINGLLSGNTLSAGAYGEFLQMESSKDMISAIYLGIAAVGVTCGLVAMKSDLPGMEKASWGTVSILSPAVAYFLYKVTLPNFFDETSAQNKLKEAVNQYNSSCLEEKTEETQQQ
jgi:hypothetical protein